MTLSSFEIVCQSIERVIAILGTSQLFYFLFAKYLKKYLLLQANQYFDDIKLTLFITESNFG